MAAGLKELEPASRGDWMMDGACGSADSRTAGKLPGELGGVCWCEHASTCPRLASRELQVLASLAEGKAYKEIASGLASSESLAHKLVHRLFLKLRAHSRTEALVHWWACCACPHAGGKPASPTALAQGGQTMLAEPKCQASETKPKHPLPHRTSLHAFGG